MDILTNKTKQYFFLPFIIVFIIPFLVFSLIAYNSLISARKSEYNYFETMNVQQSEAYLYDLLSTLDRTTLNIGNHPQLTSFKLQDKSLANQSAPLLKRYATLQPVIDDIMVYYPRLDNQYFTSNGYLTGEALIHQKFDLAPQQADYLMNQIQSDHIGLVTLTSKKKLQLLYLTSIQSSSAQAGRVVYALNASYLYKALSDNLHHDFALLSNDGHIIISSLNFDSQQTFQLANHQAKDNFTQLFQDKYFPVTSQSLGIPFNIVSLVSKQTILGPLRRFQLIFSLGTFGILMFGLFLSHYYANRNYQPLKRITDQIAPLVHNEILEAPLDPYTYLETNMSHLISQQHHLTDMVQDQRSTYLSTLYRILLEGYQLNNQHLAVINSSLAEYEESNFAVLAKTYGPSTQSGQFLQSNLPSYEIVQLDYHHKKLLDVYLIHYDATQTSIQKISENFKNQLLNGSSQSEAVFIGRSSHTVTDLYRSFLDTLFLLDSHKGKNTDNLFIFTTENTDPVMVKTYTYNSQFIKLKNGFDNANLEIAIQAIDDILDLAKSPHADSTSSKSLLYEIINTILKQANEYHLQLSQTLLDNLVSTFNPYFSREYLVNLVQEVVIQMSDKIAQDNDKKNNEILNYIHNHFRDFDFSLDTLSDQFNLPQNQINQILRDNTGVTFSKYVQHLRFEFVKNKLVTTDEKIKEIIQESGYLDASNFTRQFRTLFGCTPGQYRSNYRQS